MSQQAPEAWDVSVVGPPAPAGPPARPATRLVVATWLLPVVALLLVGAIVILSLRVSRLDGRTAARDAALHAAQTAVVNSISFDYRTLDQQFAEVRRLSTGAFLADFNRRAADIKSRFTKQKVVSKATVRDAAVVQASTSEAVVVVAVDDVLSSDAAGSSQPSTLRYRLQAHMVHKGGRWLIDNVSEVP